MLPTLLCVEDDLVNAFVVKTLLKGEFEVILKRNAEEALACLNDHDFCAMLIDINLGKGNMDGIQLLKKIRERTISKLPAYAITAYAMPGDEQKLLDEGFDFYLSKPLDRKLLLESLAQHK